MEYFGDFIDYDEGRDIDPREAFYAYALPCESCGAPCDERQPATWDPELQVGPCCAVDLSGIPEVPVCAEFFENHHALCHRGANAGRQQVSQAGMPGLQS